MSENHGTITLKPIDEVAQYQKNLIPANIPTDYALKPMFESVAGAESIRHGVAAFRDFLYNLFDRLPAQGHFAKPPKKPSGMADYPFLYYLNNLLVDIGYHGKLSQAGDSLLVTHSLFLAAPKSKIPVAGQMDCLRFLTLCGFNFVGVNL